MRFSSGRVLLILTCLLALPAPPVSAADIDFPAPDTAVSEKGITTYLDLARHFIPDIKPSDSGYVGRRMIALRHIGGKAYEGGGADTFGFYDISTVRMQAEGKDRLVVLFDFAQAAEAAQGVAVLALYDISSEPKLLDAADIGFDQSTYFFDQGLMPVADGSDVILTMSTHFNSSQTYVTQAMMMVRNDKLELIDTALLFGERLCSVERQQNVHYAADPGAARPDEGRPFAPIAVAVTETASATDDDCADRQPVPAGREIRVFYNWDAAAGRYIPDSDALEVLAKQNEQRF